MNSSVSFSEVAARNLGPLIEKSAQKKGGCDVRLQSFQKEGHMKSHMYILTLFSLMLSPAVVFAEEVAAQGNSSVGWGYLAAAIAVGAAALGAGLAVAVVGSAAMGAMSEKPELAGRALIFIGLAEGIAIYGLIVAVMILGKL